MTQGNPAGFELLCLLLAKFQEFFLPRQVWSSLVTVCFCFVLFMPQLKEFLDHLLFPQDSLSLSNPDFDDDDFCHLYQVFFFQTWEKSVDKRLSAQNVCKKGLRQAITLGWVPRRLFVSPDDILSGLRVRRQLVSTCTYTKNKRYERTLRSRRTKQWKLKSVPSSWTVDPVCFKMVLFKPYFLSKNRTKFCGTTAIHLCQFLSGASSFIPIWTFWIPS